MIQIYSELTYCLFVCSSTGHSNGKKEAFFLLQAILLYVLSKQGTFWACFELNSKFIQFDAFKTLAFWTILDNFLFWHTHIMDIGE